LALISAKEYGMAIPMIAKAVLKRICMEQVFSCSTLPWRELVLKAKSRTVVTFIICPYDWLIYTLVAA
jgi:hypothetical protein